MKFAHRIVVCCAVGAVLLATSSRAAAGFTFRNITGHESANAAAGEAQLGMTVVAVGDTRVCFRVTNSGPTAMSVTGVYFDVAGLLAGGTAAGSHADVLFQLRSPPDSLPGGELLDPPFATSIHFSARAWDGVTAGEWLDLTFDLASGRTYADVLAALAAGAALEPGDDSAGTLRVGLYVRNFEGFDTASESFINEGAEPVSTPAPPAIILVATAIPFLGLRRVLRRNAS